MCRRGIALGLLWASSIVRSTCVLVLVAVPRQIIFSQVHFTAVWLLGGTQSHTAGYHTVMACDGDASDATIAAKKGVTAM